MGINADELETILGITPPAIELTNLEKVGFLEFR